MRNDLQAFHVKEPLKWITVKYKSCFHSAFIQLAVTSCIMEDPK